MKATKIITFAAGHRLANYSGKCRRLHGHNYKLEATVETANLDEVGFVIDFGDLKVVLNKISDLFDHRTLLNVHDLESVKISKDWPKDWLVLVDYNPTAENMAEHIANMVAEDIVCDKITIRLWETDTSFVEYVLNCKV